jgi:enoyl-CoA hydratase/carnithine racemase
MGMIWSIENGIGRLMISQPPSNVMTMEFFREFLVLMHNISTMKDLQAIIISGEGRHYSSGADISELLASVDHQTMLENYRAFVILENLEIPVISAIRGVCLGSAFEMALFSHFRICSIEAVLGLPESTFNLMPGLGGIHRVAELAGNATAIRLTLHGNTFSAMEALEMRLVDAVVPKKEVIQLAVDFANRLSANILKADRTVCIHKFLKPLYATFQ